MSTMITDDWIQQKMKCHAPLLYWPDVGLFYQCKCYLHYRLWPTKAREKGTSVKIIFHFERCDNNSNVITVIFFNNSLGFRLNMMDGSPIQGMKKMVSTLSSLILEF